MNRLTVQSKNRLDQGDLVSQELKSTLNGFRRWIAIYPLNDQRMQSRYHGFKYRVIDFELDIRLIDWVSSRRPGGMIILCELKKNVFEHIPG